MTISISLSLLVRTVCTDRTAYLHTVYCLTLYETLRLQRFTTLTLSPINSSPMQTGQS